MRASKRTPFRLRNSFFGGEVLTCGKCGRISNYILRRLVGSSEDIGQL